METDNTGSLDKARILALLDTWVRQRPGLDWRNYISHGADHAGRAAYRAEVRGIGRDLADARALLAAVARSSVSAETLRAAFRAYSGRLSLTETEKGPRLDYCTGQYWPTEYRRAACAVLAAALWDHYREGYAAAAEKAGKPAGDFIRAQFRRQFGRGMQSRWFD